MLFHVFRIAWFYAVALSVGEYGGRAWISGNISGTAVEADASGVLFMNGMVCGKEVKSI